MKSKWGNSVEHQNCNWLEKKRTFEYLWGDLFTWAITLGRYMTCTEASFYYRSYLKYKGNRKYISQEIVLFVLFFRMDLFLPPPLVALLLSIYIPDKQLLHVWGYMPLSQGFGTLPAWKHQTELVPPVLLILGIFDIKGFCAMNTWYECYKPLVLRLVTLENGIIKCYL